MSRLLILAGSGSPWLPEQASTSAVKVDAALSFVFWISAFFFLLIVGLMLLFVFRYRQRRAGERGSGKNKSTLVEIVWTVIPVIVVAAVFWAGFVAYLDLVTPPKNTYDIQVVGQKWNWLFQYPNGWVDNELHVPVDQPVKLLLRSQDVTHSFYVPAFRSKMDVVPGRINQMWFEATKVGDFPILCAEYCGTGHSDMHTRVIVHEPGGFEKWLKNAASLLSPAFRATDLLDVGALLNRLKSGTRPVDEFARSCLSAEAKTGLEGWAAGSPVSDELAKSVLDGLNEAMKTDPSIFTPERFAGVVVTEDVAALVAKEGLAGEELLFANRYLFASAYPDALRMKLDLLSAGSQIYGGKGGCKQCHSIDGTAGTGPSLADIFGHEQEMIDGAPVAVDEEYLRESIMDPRAKVVKGYQAVMPTYEGRLKDREVDALISFIKSLSRKGKDEGK